MAAKVRTRRVFVTKPRRRSNHKMTVPLAIVAGFAPLVNVTWDGYKAGGMRQAVSTVATALIPFDVNSRKVTFANLGLGLFPIILGILTHKYVGGSLGVNRFLAKTRIPLIRL